jgi:ABC-type dipeptide/oligopeptide/nickel transport system ATPase component
MSALLNVQGLKSGYGVVEVLRGVDLQVMPGELVALLGSNGAGKTTLNLTLSGLVAARGGQVGFDGQDITGLHSRQVVMQGLIQVPEGRKVFRLVGCPCLHGGGSALPVLCGKSTLGPNWILRRISVARDDVRHKVRHSWLHDATAFARRTCRAPDRFAVAILNLQYVSARNCISLACECAICGEQVDVPCFERADRN